MAHRTETILIVEDDAGVAQLQRRQLERAGFRAVAVTTIDMALAAVDEQVIDLVIADFRLAGGMTGLDLHTQLRASGHDLPVIIVTGFSDEDTAIQALRAGVRDFVTKSTEYLDYLPEAVGRVLRQTRIEEALRKSEERSRLIARATNDVLCDWDLITDEVWWNDSFEILFGYRSGQTGRGIFPWVFNLHPTDSERVVRGLADVLEGLDSVWCDEYRFQKQDGTFADVFHRCYIVRDDECNPIRIVASLLDITDRKRAECALRESNERFLAVTQTAHDAIVSIDREGEIVFWNPAAEKIFGFSTDEVLGQPITLVIPDRYQADQQRALAPGRDGGSNRLRGGTVELYGRRKDGCEFPMEISLGSWETGRGSYHSAIIRDITERKRAEEALQESEASYRVLTDVSPQIVWTTDADGATTDCSQRWYDYSGFTKAQTLGDGWISVIRPDYRGPAMTAWSNALVRGGDYENELPFLRASDGMYRWHLVRGVPIRDDAGQIQKWVGVAIDIHDRRQMEHSLRESEDRFQAFMNNGPMVAFIRDTEGRMLYADATFERRFGLRHDGWWGKTDAELWSADIVSRLRASSLAVLAEGHVIESQEELPLPDGTTSYWSMYTFPVRESTGQTEIGCMAIDITEHKRAEAALLEKEAQLHQSQKLDAVGQLAGGVAHEYNNLLQAILGYTSFALDSLPDDHPACEDLQQVEKATERAGSLTRQLLGFSRRQPLRRDDLNPNEQVADLLKMLRPLLGADIDLRTALASDVGSVNADPAMLQQMLLNLCINARDAMPSGGRLTIQTENVDLSHEYCEANVTIQPGRYVLFTVADTGCGMAEAVKARMFEPFFTTKEVGKGTGLGLAMVYGVVSQHGGGIHVYSEPGSGTVFRIHLPRVAGSHAVDVLPPQVAVKGGGETILVADDETFVRDIAIRTLSRAGYTVLVATDGAEAIRIFDEHSETIDIALLDVVMPKAGGDQVYRHIRACHSPIPVIFCSGYDPDTNRTEFIANEGLRLLQKPFDPKLLLQSVRSAIDGRLMQAEIVVGNVQ